MKLLVVILAVMIAATSVEACGTIGVFPPRAGAPAFPAEPVSSAGYADDPTTYEIELSFVEESSGETWTLQAIPDLGSNPPTATIVIYDEKGDAVGTGTLLQGWAIAFTIGTIEVWFGTASNENIGISPGFQGIIFAMGGDDTISGGSMADYIYAGDGDDLDCVR